MASRHAVKLTNVETIYETFDIDEKFGFLSSVPPALPSHLAAFVAWESFLKNVPELVKNNFYQQFDELPAFPLTQLGAKVRHIFFNC